jgi:hypothetical protein
MTLVEALAEISTPFEIIHWIGTRTIVQAIRECPKAEWRRWIKNADIKKHCMSVD